MHSEHDKKKNYAHLHRHDQQAYRALNNLYVECSVIVETLQNIDNSAETTVTIDVPGASKETAKIKRSGKQLQELLQTAADRREYEKTIVLIVSLAEDYLFSYARLLLRAFPDRLDRSFKGKDGKTTIELTDVLNRGLDVVVEEQIQLRILGASYASPAEYINYLSSILRHAIRKETFDSFIEMKASRDIIVHAQGIANEKYLEKSNAKARAKVGELLPIDEAYFKSVIRSVKQLYEEIYEIMLSKYGDDDNVAAILNTKGL